jgi:phage terminase large subunit-like protein
VTTTNPWSPLYIIIIIILLNIVACVLASLPARVLGNRTAPHPPSRDSAWDRQPQAAIWFAGETLREETENLQWLTPLRGITHHQAVAWLVLLVNLHRPSSLGLDLNGGESVCCFPGLGCPRGTARRPALRGNLQARPAPFGLLVVARWLVYTQYQFSQSRSVIYTTNLVDPMGAPLALDPGIASSICKLRELWELGRAFPLIHVNSFEPCLLGRRRFSSTVAIVTSR